MKYRKLRIILRISTTLLCLALSTLVIIAWCEPMTSFVQGHVPDVAVFSITSFKADGPVWDDTVMAYLRSGCSAGEDFEWFEWGAGVINGGSGRVPKDFAFEPDCEPLQITMCAPHWFLVSTLFTLAAIPWLPAAKWLKRFSLRTLLIATTLVAVGLGVVVWMR